MTQCKYHTFYLLLAMLLTGLVFLGTPVAAAQTGTEKETTMSAPTGDIETVPNDPVPIEQAPSTRNQTSAMEAFFIFAISWTIIYSIIKAVRRKYNDRMLK